MCLKDRFQDNPEPSGAVLTVPLAPIAPSSLKRGQGRKTGGVFRGVAVNLASAAVKWASFYPNLYVFLNELQKC